MLEFQQADQPGSLRACGVGLTYYYDIVQNRVLVYLDKKKSRLIKIQANENIKHDPKNYIRFFEKASQVKALIYSNHKSISLAETMDEDRLKSFLNTTHVLADTCLDLKNRSFEKFTQNLKALYKLDTIKLRQMHCNSTGSEYFRVSLKTKNNNEVVCRAMLLHGLLLTLSEKITRELIVAEFSMSDQAAHNLLALSSRLSILSRIYNDDYVPSVSLKSQESGRSEKAEHL